jgi:tetratricopeptide (TPR) repeat protein
MATQQSTFDFYLSYAREDAEHVDRIARFLGDAGLSLWYDQWSLVPGEHVSNVVMDALKSARTILLFVGSQSLTRNQAFELGAWQGTHPKVNAIVALLPSAESEGLLPISGARIVDFRKSTEADALSELVNALLHAQKKPRVSGLQIDVPNVDTPGPGDEAALRARIENKINAGENDLELARLFRDLATVLRMERRYEDANAYYRRALATLEPVRDATAFDYARIQSDLGASLKATNRLTEAEPMFRDAIRVFRKSTEPRAIVELAVALNNFAALLGETHRVAEAEESLREAVDIARATFGETDARYAVALSNLGGAVAAISGREREAEALYRGALAVLTNKFGSSGVLVSTLLNNLAQLLRDLGDLVAAEAMIRRSVELTIASQGEQHPNVATALMNLTVILGDLGRFAEAREAGTKAVSILEASVGPEQPITGAAFDILARMYLSLGEVDEAKAAADRALAITLATRPEDDPSVASRFSTLAAISFRLGDLNDAIAYAERALTVIQAAYGPDEPQTKTAQANLATIRQGVFRDTS